MSTVGTSRIIGGDTLRGEVKFWDLSDGRLMAQVAGHANDFYSLQFSPDGKRLAVGGSSGAVLVLDAGSASVLTSQSGLSDLQVSFSAFSPDLQLAAYMCSAGAIGLREVATGKQRGVIQLAVPQVLRLGFSPNGQLVAAIGRGSNGVPTGVTLWDAKTMRSRLTLNGHAGGTNCFAFSPDGKTIATAGNDSTIRIWALADGKELLRLSVHPNGMWPDDLAYSADGLVLASASGQTKIPPWPLSLLGAKVSTVSQIKLWNVRTGQELRTFVDPDRSLQLAFAPDGRTLASVTSSGYVKVWGLHLDLK